MRHGPRIRHTFRTTHVGSTRTTMSSGSRSTYLFSGGRLKMTPAQRIQFYVGLAIAACGVCLFAANMVYSSQQANQVMSRDIPLSDPDFWEKSQAQHAKSREQGGEMMIRAFVCMAIAAAGGLTAMLAGAGAKVEVTAEERSEKLDLPDQWTPPTEPAPMGPPPAKEM